MFAIAVIVAGIIFIDSNSFHKNITQQKKNYERIISLSPSTTETLFALGLGNKVVGRTRFCNYPPEVKNIAEVGGYVDPNYEAMIALDPDLIILLPEQEEIKQKLKDIKLNFLTVNNKTISDIKNTIKIIGNNCNAQTASQKLLSDIDKSIKNIKEKTKFLAKPKVIISIGRTFGNGTIKEVYVAGKNTFYDELITFAGGTNAIANNVNPYPMLSAEGLIHINPQVIIDFVTDKNITKKNIMKDWQSISSVDAIKNNRVVIFSNDYIVIPGPRFILLLKDLAKTIHPEVNWGNIEKK